MNIILGKPLHDDDFGVHPVEITLDEPDSNWLSKQGITLTFALPSIPGWSVRPDEGFKSSTKEGNRIVFEGQFAASRWVGGVQLNGVNEDENPPHSINDVIDALRQNVTRALEQLRSRKRP